MTIVGNRIHTDPMSMEASIRKVVAGHAIGELVDWRYIEVGLEDCNILITGSKGKFLLKVFSKTRLPQDTERVSKIIEQVSTLNGLYTQKIVHGSARGLNYLKGKQDPYVLLNWVEGEDLFSQKRVTSTLELNDLMRQVAVLHTSNIQPPFFEDMWAVGNIRVVYDMVKEYLSDEEKRLCSTAKDIFEKIDHEALPKAFVHGDLTKQNVIAVGDGRVGIIDFSVSNWYPRIQEHAAIIANLVYSIGDEKQTIMRSIDEVVDAYQKYIELTDTEKEALFGYVVASFAMSALGSYKEKYISGSTLDEIDFWLKQGISGLSALLA